MYFTIAKQISVSTSKRDVLRGMHTSPYSKLVGVTSGAVYDVIVDLREDSPTFGKWIAHILSRQNCRQIHIPAGCAHGYLALEDTTMFYLQAGVFTPSLEQVRLSIYSKIFPTTSIIFTRTGHLTFRSRPKYLLAYDCGKHCIHNELKRFDSTNASLKATACAQATFSDP